MAYMSQNGTLNNIPLATVVWEVTSMNFKVISCFANFHQSTVSVISANHIKFIVKKMRFVLMVNVHTFHF